MSMRGHRQLKPGAIIAGTVQDDCRGLELPGNAGIGIECCTGDARLSVPCGRFVSSAAT